MSVIVDMLRFLPWWAIPVGLVCAVVYAAILVFGGRQW